MNPIKINAADLLAALKLVAPAADSKPLVDGADTVVFDGTHIHTYNDLLAVSVPLVIPGLEEPGALKAAELLKLISKFKGAEVTLTPGQQSWLWECGKAKAEMAVLSKANLERVTTLIKDREWSPLPADFQTAVAAAFIPANSGRLPGVAVSGDTVNCTDEIRIVQAKMSSPVGDVWWMPDAAADVLRKNITDAAFTQYSIQPSWLSLRKESGLIFSTKLLDVSQYPTTKTNTLIGSHAFAENLPHGKFPKALMEALERASTFSQSLDKRQVIVLKLFPGDLVLSAKRQTGSYEETLDWETAPVGLPVDGQEVIVDPSMLEFVLGKMSGEAQFHLVTTATSKGASVRMVFTKANITMLMGTFKPKAAEVPKA